MKQDLNVNQASVSKSLIFTCSKQCLTVKQIGMSVLLLLKGLNRCHEKEEVRLELCFLAASFAFQALTELQHKV